MPDNPRITTPTAPVVLLRDAALGALREAGIPLRRDGWDARLEVVAAEPYEDHFYDVRLSIRVGHAMPIPDEARCA